MEKFTCPSILPPIVTGSEQRMGSSSIHPSPFSCSQFYSCDDAGNANLMSCDDGLYYNAQTAQCDWKDNVECDPGMKEENKQRAEKVQRASLAQQKRYIARQYVYTPFGYTYVPAVVPYFYQQANVAAAKTRIRTEPESSAAAVKAAENKNVLCYFTNWGTHRQVSEELSNARWTR